MWTKTYGEGVGNCIIEISDSNLVILGSSVWDPHNPGGGGDLRLLKINSDGDTIWTKTYGDTNYDDCGYSVRETSDGGFIIVGSTASFGANDQDVWLLRTDEYGDTLWTKTFGGDSADVGKCIQITNDGGYIIVGSTKSFGAGGEDVWLIKTDSNGNALWTKTYGDSLKDWGNYVIQTSDSGFVLVGGVNWGSDRNCWLIKTDTNGDSLFGKAIPNTRFGQCVIETIDGYLLCGVGLPGPGFLAKTNSIGDTLWFNYGLNYTSICKTSDGFYLLAGDFGAPGSGSVSELHLYDGNGNIIWVFPVFRGMGTPELRSVIQTHDNSFFVAVYDPFTIVICKIWTATSGLTLNEEIVSRSFSLSQNYPNPFNPTTIIEFTLPKTSEVSLKVFNILGEEVTILVSDRLSTGSYSYKWDASNLASGVYLYRLQAGDYVEIRKMILMR
jgi:hypothetical protein